MRQLIDCHTKQTALGFAEPRNGDDSTQGNRLQVWYRGRGYLEEGLDVCLAVVLKVKQVAVTLKVENAVTRKNESPAGSNGCIIPDLWQARLAAEGRGCTSSVRVVPYSVRVVRYQCVCVCLCVCVRARACR
jgi:hypothetical protein